MKKITLLGCLFALASVSAQNAPIDFETGGFGAGFTWTVFENATNPPLAIIANPDQSGINTSSTVAAFTALQAGNPWAGTETQHGSDVGTFTLTPATSVIKIMVWKTAISDVGIKLADASGGSLGEIKVPNTLVNQWEELSFNFSAMEGIAYDQVIVFPDFVARPADRTIYFDNITFNPQGAMPTEPLTAAPTPTEDAANVLSMFSNAYANVTVDTWRTDWSVATLEDIQIAGNDTKKYTGLSFVGIETVGANLIDATDMNTFHIDIWTPNMTTFRVKLVDFGADAGFGGGDDTEHELEFTPTQAGWNSYDLPLSTFTNLTSRAHIAQLILSGNPAGSGTLYVDNVYFSNSPVAQDDPTVAAPTPTRDPANVISMFSNAYTNVPVNTWRTDWSAATLEEVQIAGNDTKKYTALNFVGIETVGENLIDASNMLYFHVDAWTPNMTTFRIKLVDFGADANFGGGDDVEHELTFTPTLSGWNSYDIPLSDFTGLTTREHIAQLIFSGIPVGAGKVYIDNVYFASQPLSVAEFNAMSISVYPNPVAAELSVVSASEITKTSIFNLMGQEVLTFSQTGTALSFDVSTLASGVYIIKTQSETASAQRRFVKR